MIQQISRNVKVGELKQQIYCLNVSMDCCRARIVIQHELLDETRNYSLVTRVITAKVGDMISFIEIYIHSLPKSCDFKLRIRLSLGCFASIIFLQGARLAWNLAGRKCRLSTPCVPVGGWHCENSLRGYLCAVITVFSQQDGIPSFYSPKGFQRSLAKISLLSFIAFTPMLIN
jgi:hypothetical protein